jgi:hypothetical protein
MAAAFQARNELPRPLNDFADQFARIISGASAPLAKTAFWKAGTNWFMKLTHSSSSSDSARPSVDRNTYSFKRKGWPANSNRGFAGAVQRSPTLQPQKTRMLSGVEAAGL